MFRIESQWVYFVTDSNSENTKSMLSFIEMAKEGYNLAFIFNTSIAQEGKDCPSSLFCLAGEIAGVIAEGYEITLQREMKNFSQVVGLWLK